MVGNQFGFYYLSNHNIIELFDNVNIRLEDYLSCYNLVDEGVLYIQLSFRTIDKKIYYELKLDSQYILDI